MSGQKIIDGLREMLDEPVLLTIAGSADFARANKSIVHIYDPRDPKGTMQRHEVEAGAYVEVPAGWTFSTTSAGPDALTSISAREKDYGI